MKIFTAARRPGTYLRIVEEGEVKAEDAIEVIERPTDGATVLEAFACKTGDRQYLELLRRTIGLAPSWQMWLARTAAP